MRTLAGTLFLFWVTTRIEDPDPDPQGTVLFSYFGNLDPDLHLSEKRDQIQKL
jgi:hypothetical protein